jgi:hypothetical protein
MIIPFHLKRNVWSDVSPQILSKPQVTEHRKKEKRERKRIEKEEKGEEKEKLQESLQIKGKSRF